MAVTDFSLRATEETQALGMLKKAGPSIRFPARTEIFRQGDAADQAFLLEEGLVVLKVSDEAGRECLLAWRLGGSLLGSASILESKRCPATVVAQTEIKVVAIPATNFLALVTEETTVSRYLHQVQASELHNWIRRVSGAATLKARERLEEFLWEWMTHCTCVGRCRLPFSDAEIARFISITPQHLITVFHELEADGILRRIKGVINIPDVSRLFHREQ